MDTLTDAVYFPGVTMLYEVCDKSDPHVVEEEEGIYLIGQRIIETGKLMSEYLIHGYSATLGTKRPFSYVWKFSDVPKNVQHEGFMITDYFSDEPLCKIKSTHYLSKKALMRLGKGKVDVMYDNPSEFKKRLDEEFYSCLDYIVSSIDREDWRGYSDQQRRLILEDYFNG